MTGKKNQPVQAKEENDIVHGLVDTHRALLITMMEIGYFYIEMKKFAEAEKVFQGLSALTPHSEVPHMALGNLYFSQSRMNHALKSHQKALQLAPASAAPHCHCAEILFFQKKDQEALEHLKAARALECVGPVADFAKSLQEAYDLGVFAQASPAKLA